METSGPTDNLHQPKVPPDGLVRPRFATNCMLRSSYGTHALALTLQLIAYNTFLVYKVIRRSDLLPDKRELVIPVAVLSTSMKQPRSHSNFFDSSDCSSSSKIRSFAFHCNCRQTRRYPGPQHGFAYKHVNVHALKERRLNFVTVGSVAVARVLPHGLCKADKYFSDSKPHNATKQRSTMLTINDGIDALPILQLNLVRVPAMSQLAECVHSDVIGLS